MLIVMCIPKFDICQGAVAPNCFKSHTSTRCFDFFHRKVLLISGLSNIISSVPDNLSGLIENIYSGLLFRPGIPLEI